MSMAVHSLTPLPASSFRGAEQSKPRLLTSRSLSSNPPPIFSLPNYHRQRKTLSIFASVSVSNPELRTGPDDLVASILSKPAILEIISVLCEQSLVMLSSRSVLDSNHFECHKEVERVQVTHTDGGVLLKNEEHKEVAAVAEELLKYCVDEPVKCPLIFGEWDVVYCSRPTSPGGGYRSALGRLVFKTKEMIQVVEAPDTVRNKVAFSAFGFLDGEVSLKGTLTALDDKWIQVVFEPPELKIGALEFTYGGQSEVKLQITYVDDKIRLGRGSKGSLFVFQRLG